MKAFLTVLFAMALNGCLYMDVKIPLDRDVSVTRLGDKVGKSSSYSVLWLFAWGNSGTEAAATNGGLKTINHMDQRLQNVLFGVYTRSDTIVYGD